MKKHLIRILIGLTLTMLFLLNSLNIIPLGLVRQLELWSYDHRLLYSMPNKPDDRIVIVDIDEKSLAEIGRWPWGRNQVARMLDQLFDRYHIAVVGFDVVFAEPDTSSGLHELERLSRNELKGDAGFLTALKQSRTRLDYDTLLASRMKNRPVVLGYYFANEQNKNLTSGLLPRPAVTKQAFSGGLQRIPVKSGYGANIRTLQKAAERAGHFNPDPDQDGVTRRVPMLQQYNGNYYESLSLAVLRTIFGQPEIIPGFPGGKDSELEWLQIADLKIPVDRSASALIPYRGPQGSFPYVSAADIIKGRVKPEQLKDAIVLVGTTAPGLMDLRSTPVAAVYAGVEIHANMIAGMLDTNLRHAPTYASTAEAATLLIGGVLLALLLPGLGPLWSSLAALLVTLVAITINYLAWRSGLVLPIASQVLLFPALYAFNASYGFLVESRSRRQITGLFGQYVPPQIVQTMSKDPENFTMAAEQREMTVLFTDVVGFTTISEALDPKTLSKVMNDYLSAMTEVIYQHGGTVDKYIGDAIMAFWGAPLHDPDHALHAVQAAMAMQKRMELLRTEYAAQGLPELSIGIGINSGLMRVGNMGSSYRVAYTVMGDAVNLASRLEGLTRQYGVWIITGQATRAQIPDMAWLELDLVRVKGKQEPVAIFEPCGTDLALSDTEKAAILQFNMAVAAYRAQDWALAEKLLQESAPPFSSSPLFQLYRTRIQEYLGHPPPADWDGVCTFTTK